MCKKTASDGLFCGFPTGIVLYWQRNTVLMRESPINKTRIACFPAGGEAARGAAPGKSRKEANETSGRAIPWKKRKRRAALR